MKKLKKDVPQASEYPEVMSRREVAHFLGISIKSVETYTKNGLIPHTRLGRRYLFSKTMLMQWLERGTIASMRDS